jgi:hypothetical protein
MTVCLPHEPPGTYVANELYDIGTDNPHISFETSLPSCSIFNPTVLLLSIFIPTVLLLFIFTPIPTVLSHSRNMQTSTEFIYNL